MLDKIIEKLNNEIEKILEKNELSFEEIDFLDRTRSRMEMNELNKQMKIESEENNKKWRNDILQTICKS